MKKKFGYFVLEIIPVMIGVFLGFMVSNWAESRKKTSQTKILTANIIGEIVDNTNKIREVIDYHKMLRDSSIYNRSLPDSGKNVQFFQGLRSPVLSRSVFETGVQTGVINELSFEKLSILNELYAQQEAYVVMSNLYSSGLVNIIVMIDEDEIGIKKSLQFLIISMTDFVIQEQLLLEKYEIVLSKIKEETIVN